MSNPNISADLSDADKATIIDHLNQVKALLPFLVNLDPATRRRLRKTGSKREGYVQDVYKGALGNPEAIPANFNMAEWTRDENLNLQLGQVREAASGLLESIDDTVLSLGNERIKQADGAYVHLKQGAKSNSALTTLITRIARQFAGQGRKALKTTFNVPAGGQVTVTDVATGTQFVNTGSTELSVYKGETATAKPVIVPAGEAITLDTDATTITVTNINSTGVAGVFTVKHKTVRR